MIRDVKDLSPDQKLAVESLLGREAKGQPVSAEEADDIINEAMRKSRPGFRPRL
ncbi:hypothetical protein SBA6_350019 [Candidatus Sulfopaludibacter sp. SbA6]|nr:hypothetical protein SBA6_350019 [Candidatus Sulfopaludibacter sp. SbA6]